MDHLDNQFQHQRPGQIVTPAPPAVGGQGDQAVTMPLHVDKADKADNADRARVDAALRASEERYRTLFTTMDQGFCVVEKVDTDAGQPSDFRWVTANPAFERHTGLRDVVGKTMRAVVSDIEEKFMDIFDDVVRSGAHRRFEAYVQAFGAWMEAEAFPTQQPGQVAVLFSNVSPRRRVETALRESEERQTFLLALADRLRPIADPVEVMAAASEALGRHLGVGRCGYGEVDATGAFLIVERDWTDGMMASLKGTLRLDDFGPEFVGAHRAGRTVVLDDALADARARGAEAAFDAIGGLRASLAVPLLKDGRWVAVFSVQQTQPRHWTPDEEVMVREVAERTWAAVERARAEAALRESEERYRTLFDSIDEGFCVIEVLFDAGGAPVDYRFVEINPAFERQTGLEDAEGKTVRELAPDLEAHWFETYGRVVRTGEPVRFVNEARALNERWFDVYAFRLGGAESRMVAVLFTDITARKRVEADIARLAAIVEGSHDAIFRCELDGTIVDWNRGAEELYGYTAAEIVGRNAAELVPVERVEERAGPLERLQRGEDVPPLETVRRSKDGRLIDVEVRPSAVRDATGRIIGVGVIARDVSARKRLERAQEDFLAMASHDLKSPVTVLRGRAQLMRRRKKYDEAAVDAILEQSRRIERLVNDLQEVVRLEAGPADLRYQTNDLGQLAREAVERIQPQAKKHRLRVVEPGGPVVGVWDRDRLGQVLDNLLGNAVKYSPPGSEVVVRVTAGEYEVRLSVTDDGPGIAPGAMPLLFERFYRADATGAVTGLGLGLYITRMLVEAHGGRITAESTLGEGSTFTVVLPIDSARDPHAVGHR